MDGDDDGEDRESVGEDWKMLLTCDTGWIEIWRLIWGQDESEIRDGHWGPLDRYRRRGVLRVWRKKAWVRSDPYGILVVLAGCCGSAVGPEAKQKDTYRCDADREPCQDRD